MTRHINDLEQAKFQESERYPKTCVRAHLVDSQGNSIEVENNSLSVILADQTTELVDQYLCSTNGTTNPSSAASLNDKNIAVEDTTGAAVGNCINISENGRSFQSLISSIDGNTITFLSPLDQDITTNAVVEFGEWDISTADGSTNTVIFKIQPPAGATWDITRINIVITDNSPMDDGRFGGISQLTNGLVLRVTDSYYKNLWLVSNNSGFKEYGSSLTYASRAPAGQYGLIATKTFAGQPFNGVVLRLNGDTGDQLQLIVQDDLTALTKMSCVAQGHLTT